MIYLFICFKGNEDIGVFLIEKGCDYNFHDRHSVTPFEDAVNRNLSKVSTCILKIIIQHGKSEHRRALYSNKDMIHQ